MSIDWLFHGDFAPVPIDYRIVALSLLLSFLCGHMIAWLYCWTHHGLSYSRSFVRSLIVLPVIVALVLMVLSNNVVTAFGLMAVLAIVRFRNVLRDTLDTTYLLASIVLGMCCGTQRFTTAVIGCGVLGLVFVYLWLTAFGTRQLHHLTLNLSWQRPLQELPELLAALRRHVRTMQRTSQHSSGVGNTDLSYRLLLRDPERVEEMMEDLRAMPGVAHVYALAAENESEL